jgi:hypothetical protein
MWWNGHPMMGGWGFMFPLFGLVFMVIVIFLLFQFFGTRCFPMRGGNYNELEDLKKQIREIKDDIENLKKRT